MDVFEAIADPVRRDLVAVLAGGPVRVADLAADQPVSRPAVSRHLRVLGEAGVVTAEDRGRERHYALVEGGLAPVAAWLADLAVPAGGRPRVAADALDALDLEVRRTVRERRTDAGGTEEETG